jgi:hypothetical protein
MVIVAYAATENPAAALRGQRVLPTTVTPSRDTELNSLCALRPHPTRKPTRNRMTRPGSLSKKREQSFNFRMD